MIPLTTQYDNKYRKMVWSEHVAVLRFISCTEDELIFTRLEDYVKERRGGTGEKDDNYELSLLKSYNSAMNSRQLRPDSLPYKIAKFYLEKKWEIVTCFDLNKDLEIYKYRIISSKSEMGNNYFFPCN